MKKHRVVFEVNVDGAEQFYDVPAFGNVSLLHFTDCHAQLLPIYYREPSINLGVGSVQSAGEPVWDVVEEYLKSGPILKNHTPNVPRLIGLGTNPGFATD